MSLVQFGTNIASIRKKTVNFYNRSGSAVTVYEGMPVCYLFDTTNNILGINKETNVKGATTAEGYQNEGKFMLVELPYTDNLLWFAGVVAAGPWVGKSVATLADKWLDVYEPNGAIVPVRASVACTTGITILALETDSQELTQPLSANQGRPVAIAEETRALSDHTGGDITVFADYSGSVAGTVKATDATHGLSAGTTAGVKITGNPSYNGVYTVTYIDANNFYFTATFVATGTATWGANKDLVLARLCPAEFIYQDHTGTALSVASIGTSDLVVNKIRLTTAQTTGDCTALSISLAATAQTAGSATALSVSVTTISPANTSGVYVGLTNTGTGAAGFHVMQVRGNTYGTAIVGDVNGIFSQITMRAGTALANTGIIAGIFSKVHVLTGGGTVAGNVVAARFSLGLDADISGKTAMFSFDSTSVGGAPVDYWFITKGTQHPGEDIGFATSTQGTNQYGAIKIRLGGISSDKWIPVYDTVGCGA